MSSGNGHHFIDGFEGRSEQEARAFLTAHPDLYHVTDGRVRLPHREGPFAHWIAGCARLRQCRKTAPGRFERDAASDTATIPTNGSATTAQAAISAA